MAKRWDRSCIVAVVIASSACAAEREVGSEPEVGTRAQGIDVCPEWGCGENSPVIGPWGFHELNTRGIPNAEGIVLLDFQKDGVSYQPQIINGSQLIAMGIPGTLSGTDLAGGYFQVQAPSGKTPGAIYRIHIVHVTPLMSSGVRFWLGTDDPIETYELVYTNPVAGGEVPLCNSPPDSPTEANGRPWTQPLEAILHTGDRYNAQYKLVTAISDSETAGWFNIACAGSALAKLHLNRHTTAGSAPGFTTTREQRQALLKMYVSDLCGTGHAWTRKGTPLHWTNPLQWTRLDGNEFANESLWDEHGARCLDVHRLGTLYANPDGFLGECAPTACLLPRPNSVPPPYLLSAVPQNPNP